MADIALKDVPDPLYRALSERATRRKHTVEQEAIDCLDLGMRVAGQYLDGVERKLADLREFRSSLGNLNVTEEQLQQAKREGRP